MAEQVAHSAVHAAGCLHSMQATLRRTTAAVCTMCVQPGCRPSEQLFSQQASPPSRPSTSQQRRCTSSSLVLFVVHCFGCIIVFRTDVMYKCLQHSLCTHFHYRACQTTCSPTSDWRMQSRRWRCHAAHRACVTSSRYTCISALSAGLSVQQALGLFAWCSPWPAVLHQQASTPHVIYYVVCMHHIV